MLTRRITTRGRAESRTGKELPGGSIARIYGQPSRRLAGKLCVWQREEANQMWRLIMHNAAGESPPHCFENMTFRPPCGVRTDN